MNSNFHNKRLVSLLGMGGVVPFALLMLASWTVHPDYIGDVLIGQRAYGIAILSFLGGIHWGAALSLNSLTPEQHRKALLWGVLPALIAWSSILSRGYGFAILMAGFIIVYQVDKRQFGWYGLPAWLLPLRLRLTIAVIVMLALTVIAANLRGMEPA